MRPMAKGFALMWFAFCALPLRGVAQTTAAAPDGTVTRALERDRLCTTCRDENWRFPVLAIYQTPHGNRADPRTPTCQSCHAESDAHRANPGEAAPDTVFGTKSKHVSSAQQRGEACLACHQTGQRLHWSGSEHQVAGRQYGTVTAVLPSSEQAYSYNVHVVGLS